MYDLFFFDKDFHTFVTCEFIILMLASAVAGYDIDIPILFYLLILFFVYNREALEEEDSERFDIYFLKEYKWLI